MGTTTQLGSDAVCGADRCRRDVDAAVGPLDGVDPSDVGEPSEATVTEVPDSHDRVVFEVAGLDCARCAALLEASLPRREGVSNATASHRQGSVRLDYDPDSQTATTLRAALADLGYPVETTDEAFENRRSAQWAETRIAGGVVAGLMMLVPYAGVIYPTRFETWFYGPEIVALLERALVSSFAPLFYFNLAILSGFVLVFTGKPILFEAGAALRDRSPSPSLVVATLAVGLYVYSSAAAFWLSGGVYYDAVVALVVCAAVARQAAATTADTQQTADSAAATTADADDGQP
jgi:cation transport ATPase